MKAMILMAGVLALGACATVPSGPGLTPYQAYKAEREAALTGTGPAPRTIPVALPTRAPTPAEIKGAPAPVVPLSAATVPAPAVKVAPVGKGPFPRAQISSQAHTAACARFASAVAAQDAFLRAGGPQQDPAGLDPDGDGYACGYRPYGGV